MTQLLLHVGYHKTATTWMQRLLFTPEHGYRQVAGHREAFEHIVRPLGSRFDPAPMREALTRGLAGLQEGETPVLSSEILSGNPFYGGRESELYAQRLAEVAPGARILLSIRSQMGILPSVYMQYLLRGGTMTPERFFKGANEIGYFGFAPEHFEYDRLVACYQALFGREAVYVLTQESLRQDSNAAAGALAVFAGNSAFQGLSDAARRTDAESYPEHAIPVLRRINHIQRSILNPQPVMALGQTPYGLYKLAGFLLKRPPMRRVLGSHQPASAVVQARFAGTFTASNARLQALLHHPLDLTGYP